MKNRSIFYTSGIVMFSLLLSALLCNYFGDDKEEWIRRAYYFITNKKIPEYTRELVDEKGIPFIYYNEQNGIAPGREYNATIVANKAIDYYHAIEKKRDTVQLQQFNNCINWLAEHIAYEKKYALYRFDWQQPFYPSVKSPFTSGMSSGRAIEAFTYAQKIYPAANHIKYAKSLTRGFYLPIDSGGFTCKEPGGWWFEEFADSNKQTPRILDGHIFCITGLQAYYLTSKDDSAKYLVEQGLRSLKYCLPQYDMGNGKIYYDRYHKVADKKYQAILVSQMKQLWEMTKDPVFYDYYKKWNEPLQQPYLFRVIKEKNRSGIVLYLLVSLLLMIIFFLIKKIIKITTQRSGKGLQ